MPYFFAKFSAVIPMGVSAYWSVSPSHNASPILRPFPRGTPHLAELPGTRRGALDMFSVPPAATTPASPAAIVLQAWTTVSKPLPQRRFTVRAGTFSSIPERRATCRAKYAASSELWMTFPK